MNTGIRSSAPGRLPDEPRDRLRCFSITEMQLSMHITLSCGAATAFIFRNSASAVESIVSLRQILRTSSSSGPTKRCNTFVRRDSAASRTRSEREGENAIGSRRHMTSFSMASRYLRSKIENGAGELKTFGRSGASSAKALATCAQSRIPSETRRSLFLSVSDEPHRSVDHRVASCIALAARAAAIH